MDLVLVHKAKLLGIEVHGSREHVASTQTQQLDALKQEGWLRKGKAVCGKLCVVWGPDVQGNALCGSWEQATAMLLQSAVASLINAS